MSITTYGADSVDSIRIGRFAPTPRPFQILLGCSDFLLIMLSYWLATLIHDSSAGTDASAADLAGGVGMIVGALFVVMGYFQSVYASHHLLKTVWQLRKTTMNWMLSLALLATLAFL